jgi:hypothetical protein
VCRLVIPAFRRMKQEDRKFEDTLGCVVSSRPACAASLQQQKRLSSNMTNKNFKGGIKWK